MVVGLDDGVAVKRVMVASLPNAATMRMDGYSWL